MIQYVINYGIPNTNLLEIKIISPISENALTTFQLAAWRPGRYEIGNFAQNVFPISAKDQHGGALDYKKVSKDKWVVYHKEDTASIEISYFYAAVIKNAGGTFKTDGSLVLTPVNCLLYAEHLINEPCKITVNIPDDFIMRTSIRNGVCDSFYTLAASPIVCGNKIQEQVLSVQEKRFHLVFEGDIHPNWREITKDFALFITEQLQLFGEFPSNDYYFLNLIFNEKHYHGVEHLESTLIALGPNTDFDSEAFYLNLLGISSHELFHYWNICRIRPKEMTPYDYTKENYFETGYIAEGVTTYYGDYLLGRSKAISVENLLKELSATLTKHLNNPARLVATLAESSMDLWLDGYKAGNIGRKVSIYAKGACIAFLLDLWIRKTTSNEKSLDDVMRLMWHKHGKTGIGYESKDYQKYIEEVTNVSAQWYFDEFVYGGTLLEITLIPLLSEFGMTLKTQTIEDKIYWELSENSDKSESQAINFNHWLNN